MLQLFYKLPEILGRKTLWASTEKCSQLVMYVTGILLPSGKSSCEIPWGLQDKHRWASEWVTVNCFIKDERERFKWAWRLHAKLIKKVWRSLSLPYLFGFKITVIVSFYTMCELSKMGEVAYCISCRCTQQLFPLSDQNYLCLHCVCLLCRATNFVRAIT